MVRDAAGNIPKARTAYETQWRQGIKAGRIQEKFDRLVYRRSLPLNRKIDLSSERIKEWYEAWGGNVAVSYSGGKDSSVLLHLVRKLYPEVPAVFVNTGLEYPEVVQHVKRTENCTIIRPKIPFHKVIRLHGYPIVSKKVARGVSVLRNPTEKNKNIWRLYDQGINRFGEPVGGFKVPNRWRFLVDAPFSISDKCCGIMKKEPIHRYERETGRTQFVGMLADDSKMRERVYIQNGCNAFDLKHPRSMPLGFWTNQDILQAIRMFDIRIPDVYGAIRINEGGQLYCTGVYGTGCVFCAFGIQMENGPNRFQILYDTHRHLWNYCMDTLGMSEIFDYIMEHCPDRKVGLKFKIRPDSDLPVQKGLFESCA